MMALVTGAGGFIGRRLVERLLAEGWNVRGVGRHRAPACFDGFSNLQWIVRDLAQDGLCPDEMEGVDTVFHLAGATLGAGKDERLFLAANEATTVNLLGQWTRGPDRLVFASSQVVYGDVNHLAISEDHPLQGGETAYSCSKINAENWLRWFQSRNGGCCVLLRMCGLVEGGGAIDYIIANALQNAPIVLYAGGRVCRDYLPAEKAVGAFVAASRHCTGQGVHPFNIGSGQALATMELARIICTEVGSRSAIVPVDRPAPRSNFVFDISRARAELGFDPGCLRQAVRRYARSRFQASHAR